MDDFLSRADEELLENAYKFEMLGEKEIAKKILVKYVKSRSQSVKYNVDLLYMFYLFDIDKGINDTSEAITALLIISCLEQVYGLLLLKEPATAEINNWVNVGDTSDRRLYDALSNISMRDGRINSSKIHDLKILYEALKSDNLSTLKMSNSVSMRRPIDVISDVLNGRIRLNRGGLE